MGKTRQENTRNLQEWTKRLSGLSPFTGEKEKWRMWSGKFMAGAEIKGYHVLITGENKIPADDADQKTIAVPNLLNFEAYNEVILSQ